VPAAAGTTKDPTMIIETPNTRAAFYERRFGGGYRTARTRKTCMQFGCFKPILPGEKFFDTQEPTTFPATKCICEGCAETSV
jgi:hypothetical protein